MRDYDPSDRTSLMLDKNYWKSQIISHFKEIIEQMPPIFDNCKGGIYTGCAGVAYMFYYLSERETFSEIRQELLTRARNYAEVALSYSLGKGRDPDHASSFMLDNGGVYVTSALVLESCEEPESREKLVKKYSALSQLVMPQMFLHTGSDELFFGRAGYLCGALLLNRKLPNSVPGKILDDVCNMIIQSGTYYATKHKSPCPLMFAFHGKEYLGASHGLSSILFMLMSCGKWFSENPSKQRIIKECVDFLLSNMQPNGNILPLCQESNDNQLDGELIHWCHGTPGIIYLFAKSWYTWKDERYLRACIIIGELAWRYGLLRKGPGLCHGIAGSGYVFLLLFKLTNDEKYLYRALKFAEFIESDESRETFSRPDNPYSLFEGLAGTVCYLADLIEPATAEFPFFKI